MKLKDYFVIEKDEPFSYAKYSVYDFFKYILALPIGICYGTSKHYNLKEKGVENERGGNSARDGEEKQL